MTHPYAIVVPTYRRTTSLERLLDALARQHRAPAQVVVVDQNPIGTIDPLLARSDLPIDHVRLASPNCSTARNVGFLRTRAPIVMFLDDDLEPNPDFATRFLQCAEDLEDVGAWSAIVDGWLVTGDELEARLARLATVRHPVRPSLVRTSVPHGRSAALAFRREAFASTGGFDPGLFEFARAGEDHELFARMIDRRIHLWFALGVRVRHHDREPGGAEMRTAAEACRRDRKLRAWAYKACAHAGGSPDLRQLAYLARMVLVNRRALTQSPIRTARDIRDLTAHVQASRASLRTGRYASGSSRTVDHLRVTPCDHLAGPSEGGDAWLGGLLPPRGR